MDRLDLYALFVRIAECGSFTKAAEAAGISRSAASMAIAALEARLGTRLLNRSTRRVSVTEEGRALAERCRRLLNDADEAEAMFRPSGSPHGLVRAGMPGRLGRRVVAPCLGEFLDRHPGVDVELRLADRSIDLVGSGVDCTVRVGELADSTLVARRLGRIEFINVASPAYLAEHGTPLHPRDLGAHRMVRFVPPSGGRPERFEWQEPAGPRHLEVPGRVLVDSAEAQIACALAGLGLIQIPAYDVRDDLARGALVEILPQWRAEAWPVHLLFPARDHMTRRVAVFADWLGALVRGAVACPQPGAAGMSS